MVRSLGLQVVDQRLLIGGTSGLPQATALVAVEVDGRVDERALSCVHTGAASLFPEQPLFGVDESDWPAAFLVDPAGDDSAPEHRLGEWVVALTVALQRWARDPVWRGRVIAADSGGVRLAIPWQREGVLTDTLRLALQLIELWVAAEHPPDVNDEIRPGMTAAQAHGIPPNSLRLALAALDRGVPVALRNGHVQYGWGADRMIDELIDERSGRIPTAAITGTNGKSTTALMLHHIWTTAGTVAGVCTTHMLKVGEETLSRHNMSGLRGAQILLNDSASEAAVIEMPRQTLLTLGHPCDRYDVAALLNVQDDHIGEYGIDGLEAMAELKAEVLERASAAVVVNADDALCMAMLPRAGTDRHILVSTDPATVAEHRRRGGEAVFLDSDGDGPCIVLAAPGGAERLIGVAEIPATMNGLIGVNAVNAMFAAALAWAQGIPPVTIRRALGSFHNSGEQNPGRFNFIEGLPFQVLLDFGHNPDGVREVCGIAGRIPVSGRRILCTRGVGSHRAAQFAKVAATLAETFDEFVLGCVPQYVRESPDYAGPDPVAAMLTATRKFLLDAGVAAGLVTCEPDPAEAVRAALAAARPGDLLVILAKHDTTIPIIDEYRCSI